MSKLTLTKKYEVYPEYKDSGVEWIGNIPSSWKVMPLKALFRRVKRTKHPEETLLSVYRDWGVIEKTSRDDNFNKPSEDLSPYQLVLPGDLVTNKMKTWQGSIAVSSIRGIVSPAYYVFEPLTKQSAAYYHYLLRSDRYIAHYENISKGIRVNQWDLDYPQMKNSVVLIPDESEQGRIASYLDEKTKAINSIIEKKQRQIGLLKEKRAAVINHAVTKGLNPKAKLVDSGVEWIGITPSSWELTKIKPTIKTIQAGVWGDEPKKDDNDIRCLRVADFDYEYLTTAEPKTVRNNPKLPQAKILKDGDILFEKSGGGEKTPVGRAVLYSGEGGVTCANFIDVVRVDEQKVLPAYLVFYLAALYDGRLNTKYIKQNTGIQNIKAASYFSEQIPLPPKNEQEEIVQYLQNYLDKDRLASEKLNKTITLLQEFKSSLISHVVTGKIKV